MSKLGNIIPAALKPPEIKPDLSNASEWYTFYAEHGPSPTVLRLAQAAVNLATDTYTGVPEGTREKIEAHAESGNPTLILMDHDSIMDPFNAGASVHKHPFMRWIIGKTVIPARPGEFSNPVMGLFLTYAGAKPVVREKDMAKHYAAQGLSDTEVEARVAAAKDERIDSNSGLQQVEVGMVNDGFIYATFPGGERKTGDPSIIQKPVKDGPRKLLEAIDNPEDAKIIYIAFDYGGGRFMKRLFTPTIHMDIRPAPALDDDFNENVETALQENLDAAIANRRGGVPLSPFAKAAAIGMTVGAGLIANKLMSRR